MPTPMEIIRQRMREARRSSSPADLRDHVAREQRDHMGRRVDMSWGEMGADPNPPTRADRERRVRNLGAAVSASTQPSATSADRRTLQRMLRTFRAQEGERSYMDLPVGPPLPRPQTEEGERRRIAENILGDASGNQRGAGRSALAMPMRYIENAQEKLRNIERNEYERRQDRPDDPRLMGLRRMSRGRR